MTPTIWKVTLNKQCEVVEATTFRHENVKDDPNHVVYMGRHATMDDAVKAAQDRWREIK